MVWNDPVSKTVSVFTNVWFHSEWAEKTCLASQYYIGGDFLIKVD